MRIVEKRPDSVLVELTNDEVVILANAITEICHGPDAIKKWEFGTRIGASREEAEALLAVLHERP
jgi:hypothetical protein